MSKTEQIFTEIINCKHCGHKVTMSIIAEHSVTEDIDGGRYSVSDIYELLDCPACHKITLRSYFWHDGFMESPNDTELKYLYPSNKKIPLGLPSPILRAYEAALKVRAINANAYAVLIGRVLEMVCEDRNAKGGTLNNKLKYLSDKGEIPEKLVGVANGLRNMRNVGAHATMGELTSEEIPILDDLSKAILEYVYSAPHLVTLAENRLKELKKL